MAKTKQTLRVRVTQPKGRRRKKPASRVERAFDEVKQLVSETGDRVLSRSSQRKAGASRGSGKKTASKRMKRGQERQAAAKKVGASRIRAGQQKQAEVKKAARRRGVKTS